MRGGPSSHLCFLQSDECRILHTEDKFKIGEAGDCCYAAAGPFSPNISSSGKIMDRDKLKASFGRFMRAMSDLLILNLLTLFCSFPVITIGPVLCALYTITLKIARDEPVNTIRAFFSALKKNFFQGVILGAIALFGAVIIFADGVYAFSITGTAKIVFCIVTGIIAAIWLTYVSYVFALQARYENTVADQIRNAFKLAFISPAKTVLMWVIMAIPVLLAVYLPWNFVAYMSALYLLFGVSLPVFCVSAVLRSIFDRFDPKEEE